MSILTPTNTVEPRPYQTRFVADTISAITVWTPEGFVTVNEPRTVYWKNEQFGWSMTIRAQDKRNTLRCDANEFGIVTIFYRDGRIESDEVHLNTLD